VIVPEYRPATAETGTAMAIAGVPCRGVVPLPAVPLTTICAAPVNVKVGTDVTVIVPVFVTVPVAEVASVGDGL
jgi:hypothetical protein